MSDLWIWMNGERVGTWTATRPGAHKLTYEPAWVESPRGRPLSLSLPFTADRTIAGDKVAHFFDNLLPDSKAIRERVGKRLGVNGGDSFELLTAIGRDCVGAVQLLPPDTEPEGFDHVMGVPLTPTQVEQHLLSVTADPLLNRDENSENAWRISLAGAQEKTALLKVGDIHGADWVAAALRHGLPELPERMLTLLHAVPDALERTLARRPESFPRRLLNKMQPHLLARAEQAAAEITTAITAA